jgi:hypothetical protein
MKTLQPLYDMAKEIPGDRAPSLDGMYRVNGGIMFADVVAPGDRFLRVGLTYMTEDGDGTIRQEFANIEMSDTRSVKPSTMSTESEGNKKLVRFAGNRVPTLKEHASLFRGFDTRLDSLIAHVEST